MNLITDKMEKKIFTRIIGFFVLCLSVSSCSDKIEDTNTFIDQEDGVPVKVSAGTRALPDQLECDLYIYIKGQGDTDYILKEIINFGNDDEKILQFLNTDLMQNNYRFFFVATTPGNTEISLTNVAVNNTWANLRIIANQMNLSDNYYYTVLDKTGNEILNDGTINATLNRIVGQMAIDIFRTDGNINNPLPKSTNAIESVLDRVYKIEITYKDLTQTISFDANGAPVQEDEFTGTYLQTITNIINGDLKVSVPQEDKGLVVSGKGTSGSVRIKGVCGLPSDKKIRMEAKFYYYDTTPTCNNADGGNHSSTCFKEETLTLHLPRLIGYTELLSIYTNTFTVNNAGIRFDRIIDVALEGSLNFDVVWNVTNSNNEP